MVSVLAAIIVSLVIPVLGQQSILDAMRKPWQSDKPSLLRAGSVIPVSGRHLFWSWTAGQVLYYIDPAYTPKEQSLIKQAMAKVQEGLGNTCVRFEEVLATDTKFKIKITPFGADGITPAKYCSSYPGITKSIMASRRKEQPLLLARGENGCFDGTLRSLMKLFTIVLGKRNEHQRPDRDLYITMNQSNIIPGIEIGYRLHPRESFLYNCDYDFCSITHNQPTDFAKPGTTVFTVKKGPGFIPQLDRLSSCDCQELVELYKCKADPCEFWDCDAQTPPPVLSTVPPKTPPSVSTTVPPKTPPPASTTVRPKTPPKVPATAPPKVPATAPSKVPATAAPKVPATAAPKIQSQGPGKAIAQPLNVILAPPPVGAD